MQGWSMHLHRSIVQAQDEEFPYVLCFSRRTSLSVRQWEPSLLGPFPLHTRRSEILLGARIIGEKKLSKVVTPDPWKQGARNTTEGGGRKVNENKALTMKKNR